MATKYRARSEADIYHVTVRGIAKQIVFEDDEDRRFFGKRMRRYLDESGVELYAWCFMSNHVHLLVSANMEAISSFMRKLLTSYAKYFNTRHERTGHLFQNRFDSVPIETEEQLKTTVRYIHKNPSKIPNQIASEYEWSSYREYLGRPFIANTSLVMALFESIDDFVAFHEMWVPSDDAKGKPGNARKTLSDDDAVVFAKKLLGVSSLADIASLGKPERNRFLATLKASGLPIAQIARITGIGRNIVQRADGPGK